MLLNVNDLSTMRPSIFIGLGGSGSKIVEVLARRLQAEEAWPRFRSLLHFVCIDTERQQLDRVHDIARCTCIALSDDKRRRIQLLRGEADFHEDKRVSSWVHRNYGFRQTGGKGAGQVRLESRFSLHCNIADGEDNNVRALLQQVLNRALSIGDANRERSNTARFFLFGSIAGGTGSGAALPLAYLCRSLARDSGVPNPEVYATLFLPSVFRHLVGAKLVNKVNANGYAALREIEAFMELRFGDREGLPGRMELVYDPCATSRKEVTQHDYVEIAPFDWVYLVDRPEARTIDQIYRAAGEAAYLQLFSPILAMQEAAADNWEQIQGSPLHGFFAQQYGSVGASVVTFPRKRLEAYFSRLWLLSTLEEFVVGRAPEAQGDLLGQDFAELSEDEKNIRLDKAFVQFVATRAAQELRDKKTSMGVFGQIKALRSGDTDVVAAFRAELLVHLEAAHTDIQIEYNPLSLTNENPTVAPLRSQADRGVKESRQRLDSRAAELVRAIESGEFVSDFCEKHKVSALLQRYLLLRLMALGETRSYVVDDEDLDQYLDWCLTPHDTSAGGDADEALVLARKRMSRADCSFDSDEVKKQLQNLQQSLQAAASSGWAVEKKMSSARQTTENLFNSLIDANSEDLLVSFWHRISDALKTQVQRRLDVFRSLARRALSAIADEQAKAERCRRSRCMVPPFGEAYTDIGGFYLGGEVFHDARARVSQWRLVYDSIVRDEFFLDSAEVMTTVNAALHEASRGGVGARPRPSEEVLNAIAQALDKSARVRMREHLAAMNLSTGLQIEARFHALENRPATRDQLDAVADVQLDPYVRDKLERVVAMSNPLARLDRGQLNAYANAYEARFYGVTPEVLDASGGFVRRMIDESVENFQYVEDWPSRDSITFFQGTLGVPLYVYRDIVGPLTESFNYESSLARDGERDQPLHVDERWEDDGVLGKRGPGLPNVDIKSRTMWAKARADAAQAARTEFAVMVVAGLVRRDGQGSYSFEYRGRSTELGSGVSRALANFGELPDGMRSQPFRVAQKRLRENRGLVEQCIEAYGDYLFDAEADERGVEAEAIKTLLAQFEALRQG